MTDENKDKLLKCLKTVSIVICIVALIHGVILIVQTDYVQAMLLEIILTFIIFICDTLIPVIITRDRSKLIEFQFTPKHKKRCIICLCLTLPIILIYVYDITISTSHKYMCKEVNNAYQQVNEMANMSISDMRIVTLLPTSVLTTMALPARAVVLSTHIVEALEVLEHSSNITDYEVGSSTMYTGTNKFINLYRDATVLNLTEVKELSETGTGSYVDRLEEFVKIVSVCNIVCAVLCLVFLFTYTSALELIVVYLKLKIYGISLVKENNDGLLGKA